MMPTQYRLPFYPHSTGIKIASTLDDDVWAAYGERLLLSHQLDSFVSDKFYQIDFSDCLWADPGPLMSVLLYGDHLLHQGFNVTIKVCRSEDITPDNKLPVFFFKHGFAATARNAGMKVIDTKDTEVTESGELRYLEKNNVLAYSDPPVIRAKLINFDRTNPSPKLTSKTVKELMNQAREAYEDIAHRSVFTGLLYRTQVILEETIQNVVDHAYTASFYTPALLVFARYRKGLKRLDSVEVDAWQKNIMREVEHCPFLKKEFLEDKEGCIEIFIVDHGIGIARSFGKSGKTIEGRKSIRSLLKNIFTVGKSTKSKKRADAGGLTVIHNQMVPNRDYLRGYDSGTWFGVPGGLHRPNQTIDDHPVDAGATMPVGLSWTFRIGLRGDIKPDLLWPTPNESCRSQMLAELSRFSATYTPATPEKIVDSRIQPVNVSGLDAIETGEFLVWLPQPHLGKDDIRSFFNSICKKMSSEKEWIIVIADIRTHEGTVFFDALCGQTDHSDSHINKVCLLSERMQARLLGRVTVGDKERFEVDDEAENALLDGGTLVGTINLAGIVVMLQNYDSRLIWEEVAKKKGMYISEWIRWGATSDNEPIEFYGYLVLELLQRSNVMKQLARVGLERLIGLRAPSLLSTLIPADVLVSDLCANFNSIGDRYDHTDAHEVLLGSVCVTGKTYKNMNPGEQLDIFHLFRHPYVSPPQSKIKTSTVFLWKKEPNEVIKSHRVHEARFERVGESHSISPKGRNHYTIRKRSNGSYMASRNPREFYQDIQKVRASTVRIGHWIYGDNHDILGLNMRLFVRDAFDRLNSLAWFLIQELLVNADVPPSYFGEHIQEHLDQRAGKNNGVKGKAVVVYPSHPITDKIIIRLLGTLKDSARKKVESQFIPARRLRTIHKHMASLLSPQTEFELDNALKKKSVSQIIVFDDGMVSGTTSRDLVNLVTERTKLPISKVVIVNRLREPGRRLDSSITKQYWNLDLPRIGNSESCLLCRAIEEVRLFRNSDVTSGRAQNRLGVWLEAWKGVDPNREWSGVGLQPLALQDVVTLRMGKTGHETASQGDNVQIEWSTALAVFDAELTTMTGLDDHVERLLEKSVPLNPAIEAELLTSHLVLFLNDIPPKLRTRLLLRLFALVCRFKSEDPRSSLACLILCVEGVRQGDGFEDKIMDVLNRESTDLGNVCFDVTLFLSYLYQRGVIQDIRFYRSVRLLSTPRNAPWRAYNDLYFESRGPVGNPHLLPLQELADGRVKVDRYQKVRNGALDHIDKLENLLRQLDVRQTRPPLHVKSIEGKAVFDQAVSRMLDPTIDEGGGSFESKLATLLDKLGGLRKSIESDQGGYYFSQDSGLLMKGRGLNLCREVMSLLQKFRQQFFFLEFTRNELKRGEFEDSFIDPVFKYINWEAAACEKNKNGVSFVKPKLEMSQHVQKGIPSDFNISIVCDSSVVRTFSDLLLNTGYGKIKQGESELVVMIHTEFFNDKVVISMTNHCVDNVKSTIERADQTFKWLSLNEIGGRVMFESSGKSKLKTSMTIPYAGLCKGVQ